MGIILFGKIGKTYFTYNFYLTYKPNFIMFMVITCIIKIGNI